MEKKQYITFYEYITHYPYKDPGCLALSADFRKLGRYHRELRDIDSLFDLMMSVTVLTDIQAIDAVTASLWCEYCAFVGRPISE